MANYKAKFNSPMSVDEVFTFMADFSNAPEWDQNTKSSDLLEGDPYEVGAQYKVVTGFAGRDLTLTYETIEIERPNRVVLKSGTGMAEIRDVIEFEPDGEGSVVSYEANILPHGVAKVLDPVFALIFKRVGDRAAESLKAALKAK
jgi:carbon monoxide dehydrogenase subunit G